MKKVIYVAGPYTGNVKQNIENAEEASIQLLHKGWSVITPHKNTAGYENYEVIYTQFNHAFWMENCLSILNNCDVIFMLNGYEDSKGSMIELDFAKKKQMVIFYQKDGYPEASNVNIDSEKWDLK